MRKALTVIVSVIFILLSINLYAADKPIKLVFTHWEPPSGVGGSTAIEFCKELEERTGGRVKAETALAGSLGPTAEQFELIAAGIADLGGFIPAYTPGRFPLLSLMVELPHKVSTTKPLTKTYNELIAKGYFDDEVKPTKLLWISSVTPLQVMSKNKLDDLAALKGKKIRTSGEFWLSMAPKLGIIPVSITISDMYSAIDKGVVDGTFLPYSIMDVFKIKEVVKHVDEINLTYTCFAYAINRSVYDKLPADIRTIIDELALKYSAIEAAKHDDWDKKGKENFLALGDGREVHSLSDADWAKMKEIIATISDEWISKREAKGYPAKKLIEDLNATLKKNGISE